MIRTAALALLAAAALAFAAPAAGAGQIDSLAFMAGSWARGDHVDRDEEHWTAPLGGLMVGVQREVRGGKARSFEFFRVEEREGSLFYLAQPRGRSATAFQVKELSSSRVVFENLGHDFPQRILYWREKPGELKARIEGTVDGKTAAMDWAWKASSLTP